MTERYNYGFRIEYRFPKHVMNIINNCSDEFAEKGITVAARGKAQKKEIIFTLYDVSAAEAVKRLLWSLTHIAAELNDFDTKSVDYISLRLITEAIRNLLMVTNGQGTRLKEWFKADQVMRVEVFGQEGGKLYVALDRTLK